MSKLIQKLTYGDLRQKGRSEEVVQEVCRKPELFADLVAGITHENPGVRMRVADAMEKITRKYPEYLQPYKKRLINDYSAILQKEVRWHLAQMFLRLKLNVRERQQIFAILLSYLNDDSRIVKTFTMQALADLAQQDRRYLDRVIEIIKTLMADGIPSVQSRGHKILPPLEEKKQRYDELKQ
jgi:hypothetical protein